MLINPFTTNPRYCQIYIEHILTRNALPLDRDEVKVDLMLTNMKTNIFPMIWHVGYDSLKFVCDSKMSNGKTFSRISALQNHRYNGGQQRYKPLVFPS